MIRQFNSLFELFRAFPDEQSAITHFTAIRWVNRKFCSLWGNAEEAKIGRQETDVGAGVNALLEHVEGPLPYKVLIA